MSRLRIIFVLAALAGLAFWVPSLLRRPPAETNARATPDAVVGNVPADASGPAITPAERPEVQPAPGAPNAFPGVTGKARSAGQALLDKMLGRHKEMSVWAEAERTRIKQMEPALRQFEQRIREADVRGDEMSLRLERIRSEPLPNTADYETMRMAYNDLVVERNNLVRQYEQQFAEYTLAARSFDARIAEYESNTRSSLRVPAGQR